MTKIIIVDNNHVTGAFLKNALEQETYRVTCVPDAPGALMVCRIWRPNLVMVRHTCRGRCGWTIFNQLKQMNSRMPLMLYLLDSTYLAGANWVIRAVHEVLACKRIISRSVHSGSR